MERKMHRLTAKRVESAKDGWHGDGGNLFLRVSDAGKRRHWVLRWTRGGRTTEMGLGPARGPGKISLVLARQKRDEAMAQISGGLDPVAERRRNKDAKASRKTFAEAAEALLKAKKSGWRTSTEGRASTLHEWTRDLLENCKPVGKMFVDEIDKAAVMRVVQPFWDRNRHYSARRLLTRIERTIDYATAHGWRSEEAANPASWKRFVHIAPAQPDGERKHHAALPWRAVPDFVLRLREVKSLGALTLEFVVLTATRSTEARGARWSEIDFKAKLWSIPAERMKRKRPHAVPLSDQAVTLLRKMEGFDRQRQFVFPGVEIGRCISNTPLWRLTKRVAPDVDVTSHGFRSSFRDWCGDQGVERELAEHSLAHQVGNATETAYARSSLIERRRPIIQRWADFVCGDEAPSAKVVAIGARR
jgi:integrase